MALDLARNYCRAATARNLKRNHVPAVCLYYRHDTRECRARKRDDNSDKNYSLLVALNYFFCILFPI